MSGRLLFIESVLFWFRRSVIFCGAATRAKKKVCYLASQRQLLPGRPVYNRPTVGLIWFIGPV